jgi:glutathionyl-hydroquinone reductase
VFPAFQAGVKMGKKKQKENYLDKIPVIHDKKWEVLEDGLVEITVENTGFYNWIAQKVFHKPRYSFIKLDEFGSFVWQRIDGMKTIYEIGQELNENHKKAGEQLYERLAKYFGILEHNKYVVFKE